VEMTIEGNAKKKMVGVMKLANQQTIVSMLSLKKKKKKKRHGSSWWMYINKK
jgi:hypothetical protein